MGGLFHRVIAYYNNIREWKKMKIYVELQNLNAIDCLEIIQHCYDEIILYYTLPYTYGLLLI